MDKGVEMVEIDLQRTSDGVFVLMHDASIDRTTTGKGKVSELSWKAIKQVYLRNGLGSWTTHKVPRLEEVLDMTKGKILINLDKSYNYIDELYKLLKARAMEEQVIFKGWMKPYDVVTNDLKVPLDSINFMPILDGKDKHWKTVLNSYSGKYVPMAIEIIFTTEALGKEMIREVKKTGSRVWVNALWPDMNAGHDDEMALNHPDKVYGWFIKNGVSMIQTDRIDVLMEYLDTHK
ncbi:glycerophosphodiester phosphodiesterase family protein [Flavivirga amylovorans]